MLLSEPSIKNMGHQFRSLLDEILSPGWVQARVDKINHLEIIVGNDVKFR